MAFVHTRKSWSPCANRPTGSGPSRGCSARSAARPTPQIDAFVDRKIATNSFSRSCARWLDLYPEGRVRILFYETLRDDPWRFYGELCDFLGLEPRDDLREQLGRRVNEGQREAVPARLRERIAQGWREDVAALERLVGPLPASWAAPSGGVR